MAIGRDFWLLGFGVAATGRARGIQQETKPVRFVCRRAVLLEVKERGDVRNEGPRDVQSG